MAATILEARKHLPYPPDALAAMVGDVRAYREFIPWVQHIEIIGEKPLPEGGWQGLARAIVGWRAITERFATFVRCSPPKGEVDVRLAEGPFKSLENHWRFTTDGAGGAHIHFWIAYEFKNPLLQILASANRDRAAGKIMAAFESEAHRRFGGARQAAE